MEVIDMRKCIFIIVMLLGMFNFSCNKTETKYNLNRVLDEEITKLSNINDKDEITQIDYILKNNIAYRIIGERQEQISEISIEDTIINKSIHYYFILDRYNDSKIEQDKLGTYLFNYKGELLDIIPFGSTVESLGIFFSPNGKYFGLDSGTWTIRGMRFYTYPEYEDLGYIKYKGKFFWKDDVILYTSVRDDYIQGSPFDDAFYHFIEEYNLHTKIKRVLYDHAELYDVFLRDFEHDTLIITKRYVSDLVDWRDSEKYKYKIELLEYN
jgi:hypothetical protein